MDKFKIMIVRMKEDQSQPISYLEDSLKYKKKHYYSIGQEDIHTATCNENLLSMVVFVEFKEIKEIEEEKVQSLFVGEGEIKYNKDGYLVIDYMIYKKISSDMIINNFISNSELDLKSDFGSKSYLNIEKNIDLINQMRMIVWDEYKVEAKAPENQEYDVLEKEKSLNEFSQKNEDCKRPIGINSQDQYRSEYQRDYERIVHAKAYRRLVDKAQIFTASKGDHYRTRMTHTLEVNQIARAISVGLNLNVELTEAIALAHDIGHTPFGHQGERTLDNILKNKIKIIKYNPDSEKNYYGGFKHNFQGVRVANYLEEKYVEYDGLDLSYQVLEGILKHTSVKVKDCNQCEECNLKCYDLKEFLPNGDIEYLFPQYKLPTTLEGQIVAMADEIAQRSHDLDDSFASGILSIEKLENYLSLNKMQKLRESLEIIKREIEEAKEKNRIFADEEEVWHGQIVSSVIKFFINDVIVQSHYNMESFDKSDKLYSSKHRFGKQIISFSKNGIILCDYLEKIISKKVINSSEVVKFDNKAETIVKGLFEAYYKNPRLLHKGTLRKIYIEMRHITDEVIDFLEGDREEVDNEIRKIINTNPDDLQEIDEKIVDVYMKKRKILIRAITDYIAGMTDSYAINEYNSIYSM